MNVLFFRPLFFGCLFILSISAYHFLYTRSTTLQACKEQQSHIKIYVHEKGATSFRVHRLSFSNSTEEDQQMAQKIKNKNKTQKESTPLPDVQILKFLLDKGREGLPVLRLPAFLYR